MSRAVATTVITMVCILAPAFEGALAGVPSTGQTECWDEGGKPIDCAGTGQDGALRKGESVEHRFTDNGDGTVTDNLTELVWLRVTTCFERMRWTAALAAANGLQAGDACKLSDGSVPGDWRLPNVRELRSIVDFGEFTPAFQEDHPFNQIKSGFYWSSTTVKGNPNRAFALYLSVGVESTSFKTEDHIPWPVRDQRTPPEE